MVDLIGEHRTKDRMAQMIVSLVPGEEGIQMLDRMIDMIFSRDSLVVSVLQRFTVFLSSVFCSFCRSEHCMGWEKVKCIGCSRLLAALGVFFNGCIRLNTLDNLVHQNTSAFLNVDFITDQPIKQHLAPRFQALAFTIRLQLFNRKPRAGQLILLLAADISAMRIQDVHDAQMDAVHLAVVIEQIAVQRQADDVLVRQADLFLQFAQKA